MAFKIFLRQFIEYLYLSRDENRIAVVISDITFHIMCQLCSVEETIKQLQRSEEAFASVIFFKHLICNFVLLKDQFLTNSMQLYSLELFFQVLYQSSLMEYI